MKAYLKLRSNIELIGDLVLADREAKYFCENFSRLKRKEVNDGKSNCGFDKEILLSHSRTGDTIGYVGELRKDRIQELIIKSSFIQEIWIPQKYSLPSQYKEKGFYKKSMKGYHFILPLLPASEFLYYHKGKADFKALESFLNLLSLKEKNSALKRTVMKSITSTLHVHGLHKYKAKFFPRMVRSILLTESQEFDNPIVLDPFVGSGTTLVEASFFNFSSIGIDIDKLSCLISESKLSLLQTNNPSLSLSINQFEDYNKLNGVDYQFPSWISKKFKRWEKLDEKSVYEKQIAININRCDQISQHNQLFKIALSDAISRKFNIRMMGTGVGRFALEIRKASLQNILQKNIRNLKKRSDVIEKISSAYNLKLGNAKVKEGDATKLNIKDSSIDIILTSPPYLPASSGRENYLIGKSISITALDILSEKEIKEKESVSVGAMTNNLNLANDGLPKKVFELYSYLKNDDLRNIKADPTLRYYIDLKQALAESYRVLKKNGKAIYVIGKESVFYTFKTRQVLFRVECDKIFEELAISVGFSIEDKIDLELNKKNKNARPRGLDSYFESIFILRK